MSFAEDEALKYQVKSLLIGDNHHLYQTEATYHFQIDTIASLVPALRVALAEGAVARKVSEARTREAMERGT